MIRRPFKSLKNEAKEILKYDLPLQLRLTCSVSTNPWSGDFEDDPEKFFKRSMWDISNADIIRWHAACTALRELQHEKK